MPIPGIVNCPICDDKMVPLTSVQNQDIALSSVTAKIENERKYLKTIIYICENCHNIQSFLEFLKD